MRARPQTVNISNAYAVQAAYRATGVPYELHVLDGCGHASWCWGEPSRYPDPNKQDRGCVSAANANNPSAGFCPSLSPSCWLQGCSCGMAVGCYSPHMDTIALPFVAEHLKLKLV